MVRAFDFTAVDANFFSTFRIDAKAGLCLTTDLVLGLWRFDHILVVFALWLGPHQHLTAVHYHVNVRTFAVLSARVIANNDGAVGSDDNRRAVRHTNARTTICLCLHSVSGIKLNVVVNQNYLSSRGANYTHVAFEGRKAGARWRIRAKSHIP